MEATKNWGSAGNVENVSPQVALHIAIQTMKERCQTLQQRMTVVEEENRQLRQMAGTDKPRPNSGGHSNGHSELENLREKVAELTRQKTQLTEHIAMVATENRQLWSRLSQLTKDNQNLGDSLNKIKNSLSITTATTTTTAAIASATTSTNQNLIRSKTFTQNSPNPALRPKNQNVNQTEDNQMSLEEISLKVLNDFLEGKDKVEKQCKEFIEENSIGFGYLNDDCSVPGDGDGQAEKKILDDVMGDIKKELLRQQSDLKVALSRLRQRKGT